MTSLSLPAPCQPLQSEVVPRTARIAPGDWVFHVLNRANGHGALFDSPACYREFLQIVAEVAQIDSMRILAYCAMPNHWHMLLWPRHDGDLARFAQRVSLRHTHRWHTRHQTTGRGHLYQARYKSFAVCSDAHLLTVCRYIERNPLRAGLVSRAEQWPWSSAISHTRVGSGLRDGSAVRSDHVPLTPLPVDLPAEWTRLLDEPRNEDELEAMRSCVRRGLPFGSADWQAQAAERLGLKLDYGRPGRPPRSDRPDHAKQTKLL